ncbi:MAG TPA: sulfite exporter TauE/SafE family protein [Verrucomicrobiae bacterium]
MDFVLAISLGLLGSLHCAAMCGPLLLALPVPAGGPARFITGRLIYQLGRILTYTLLGILAGLAGKSIVLIGIQRWLSIGLGVAILGGFFLSRRLALATPVIRSVGWLKRVMGRQLQQRTLRSLFLLGILNGLLPCGLVYVALAGAVSRGTLTAAIGFMAAFGLGTLPTMLGISLSGKILSPAIRLKLRRVIPVSVCLLAGLLILRGMALGIPYLSPDLAQGTCCAVR